MQEGDRRCKLIRAKLVSTVRAQHPLGVISYLSTFPREKLSRPVTKRSFLNGHLVPYVFSFFDVGVNC